MRMLYQTQGFDLEPNVIKGLAFVAGLERAGPGVTMVTGFPKDSAVRYCPGSRPRLIRRASR
jgi:hypothetical protein